jgi:thiosulfate/3-mercaptopyruvate sulfurtransferase
MTTKEQTSALTDPGWLSSHIGVPHIRVIEIAGLGQEDQRAYRAGHVPGASCWNWKTMLWDDRNRDFPSPDEFARRLGAAGIDDQTTVIVYGEPVQFGIYAWWALRYCGHDRVCLLDGGRRRWEAEGRPMTTDAPLAIAPRVHSAARRREHMRAGRESVLTAVGNSRTAILDARSVEEYRGERVGAPGSPDTGAVRYGRIPGSRHLEYLELLGTDQRFKPPADIRALIGARQGARDDEIIAYCRMGHRATVLYFALTELLGYPNVRVYDGSWTEWGNMVGMPVERG